MTITFANPALINPSNCDHWRLSFTVVADIGSKTITAMVMRQEFQANDPPVSVRLRMRSEDLEEQATAVAILEARRIGRAAGAVNLAQANVAVRNQVVNL